MACRQLQSSAAEGVSESLATEAADLAVVSLPTTLSGQAEVLYRFSRPHTLIGTFVSVCSISALALVCPAESKPYIPELSFIDVCSIVGRAHVGPQSNTTLSPITLMFWVCDDA